MQFFCNPNSEYSQKNEHWRDYTFLLLGNPREQLLRVADLYMSVVDIITQVVTTLKVIAARWHELLSSQNYISAIKDGVRMFLRQTLRRQCHREDVGVVECGLYAIVCVGETSDIVGVTSVGETSAPLEDSDVQPCRLYA